MKVVLSLDLPVAPGQGREIDILALQVSQNGPIGQSARNLVMCGSMEEIPIHRTLPDALTSSIMRWYE
jgi:hypothetical protein